MVHRITCPCITSKIALLGVSFGSFADYTCFLCVQLHLLSLQAEQAGTYYSTQVTGSANNEQGDQTDSNSENDANMNGSVPESTNDDAGEILSESKTEEAASEDGVVENKDGDSHSLKGEEGPTEMEVCRVDNTDDPAKMEE